MIFFTGKPLYSYVLRLLVKNLHDIFKHRQPNPAEEWLNEKAWTEVVWASRLLRSLQTLMDDFRQKSKEWKKFYDSLNPQEESLPTGWQKLE